MFSGASGRPAVRPSVVRQCVRLKPISRDAIYSLTYSEGISMKLATDIHRVSGTLLNSRYKMKVVTTLSNL